MATLPRKSVSEDLISVDAVAARLGVSRRSIYRLIGKGQIPAIQVGGAKRIDPAEVERFKTAHRVQVVAPPAPLKPPDLKPQPSDAIAPGWDRFVQ